MPEIDRDHYVVSKCSITDEECYGGCNVCQTAISQLNRDEEYEESYYIIDKINTILGQSYMSNRNLTVGKAELSDLEIMKKILKMPQKLIEKKYVSNEFMENHYPEWIKTTKILGITEQPEKMIYTKNYPMILIMSDYLYIVAPRLVDENIKPNTPEL